MEINFPIAAKTEQGEKAIRYLLAEGISTPEQICDCVSGVTLVEDCVLLDDAPWVADDGNSSVEYAVADYNADDAAKQYVEDGDWGSDLSGSINVSVWRVGIDSDGDDCNVEEDDFDIDLAEVVDHADAIREAMGDAGCGLNPDDHDWTSEGDGGLRENPGVWSTGGTSIVVKSHCRKCGLRRTEKHCGSQRNPGEGDSVEYDALDE